MIVPKETNNTIQRYYAQFTQRTWSECI